MKKARAKAPRRTSCDLFPYLQGFRTRATGANTIEYKIGEIFGEIKSKFQSGYSLRDALELVDALSFKSQAQNHELSELYEAKLRNMGNAGRTLLSNTDNASIALRKELLENCSLHTILDVPNGSFQGSGVKTVVLFFEKGAPTRKSWYYKPHLTQTLGKTNPLTDEHLRDFVALQEKFAGSENSWTVDFKNTDTTTYDLSVKNPNKVDETELRDPKDILAEMVALDAQSADILTSIGRML